MRPLEGLAWAGAAAACAALCWRAWTDSPDAHLPVPPPALPRPASADERAQVDELLAVLRQDLSAARSALGHPPAHDQLESRRPDGQPMLAHGLPDNPLRPGVAGVVPRCPPTPQPGDGADWVYCADNGQIEAVGLDAYQLSGSE